MHLTVELCLAREDYHRRLADESTLENERRIARQAAEAWAKEGRAAAVRDQRRSLRDAGLVDPMSEPFDE